MGMLFIIILICYFWMWKFPDDGFLASMVSIICAVAGAGLFLMEFIR